MKHGLKDRAVSEPSLIAGGVSAPDQRINLLLVTQDDHLAERCAKALADSGFSPAITVVASLAGFKDALAPGSHDLALAESARAPSSELIDAVQASRHTIPLILLTGSEANGSSRAGEHVLDCLALEELYRLPRLAGHALEMKRLREQVRVACESQLTERKQADEALQQSENRFRAMVEKSSDAISLVDAQGKVLYSSHAVSPIFGYSLEERKGKDVFELVHAEDFSETLSLFRKLLQNPFTSVSTQVRYRHKDGTWRWIEALGTNLLEEPSVKAVIINYRDVTERRQLLEQLFQAQKMEAVGRLAGGVAHDFNNLLTAILGYSDMVLEKVLLDSPLHRYASEIKKAGERAASLTRQLLAFSRLQVMSPQVLDLNATILDMEKILRRVMGEDIILTTVPEVTPGRIKADPSQIEQVILNLAINARDAMPHGGHLTLKTSGLTLDHEFTFEGVRVQPGAYVVLEITDTGCGMDAETRSRAFEPFFTTKEKGKGTGLGLSTVYGIVKQSGGYIWLSSEPGRGTALKIYLPRVDEAAGVTKTFEAAPHPHRGNETILLVEDEGAVRKLLTRALRSKGYEVLGAKNGEEALRVCARWRRPIHLMLTDVVMPQMSGRELARQITSLHSESRVLYMTGYAGNRIGSAEVLEADAQFIQKPFSVDALVDRIRAILDGTE